MSMGPFYENINNRDFRMYFNGALIYIYGGRKKGGCVFALTVEAGQNERDLAHETTHRLDRLGTNPEFPESMELLGSELFLRQDIRIHRMPLEYVPVSVASGVVRMSAEPTDRRAFKGTSFSMLTMLPVTESAYPLNALEYATLRRMRRPMSRVPQHYADGIAEVLDIGFARCMHSLIQEEHARKATRAKLLALLRDDGPRAVVPDFPLAIVRIDAKNTEAATIPALRYGIVLYRGFAVGTVHEEDGSIVFTGRSLPSDSRVARALREEGLEDMTTRMFADKVVWTEWTDADPSDDSEEQGLATMDRSILDGLMYVPRPDDPFFVDEGPYDYDDELDEEEDGDV